MKLTGIFRILLVTFLASLIGPAQDLVLRNASVVDGRGHAVRVGMTVVIRSGRISAVYSGQLKRIDQGLKTIDLTGKFLIPGLIDSHYHTMPNRWPGTEGIARRRFVFLNGVTIVRDMAGDAIDLQSLAAQAADPKAEIPRIYYSALMAGPKWFADSRAVQISHGMKPGTAPWARLIDDQTDIRQAVADAKSSGAVAIKLYERLTPKQVMAITREAHKQGMKVWSHSAVFPASTRDVVAAGVDSISHSDGIIYAVLTPVWDEYRKIDWSAVDPESPPVVELLQQMKKKRIVLDATLHIYDENVEFDLERKPSEQNKWFIGQSEWAYSVTRLAHRLGVEIVAGTDYPERPRRRGVANIHLELESLVKHAGLTPLEAISAATLSAARLLGIEKDFGSIAVGKVADIIVLNADPSLDIRNTRKIELVLKAGVIHKYEVVPMAEQ
jgi:hypothetical protein